MIEQDGWVEILFLVVVYEVDLKLCQSVLYHIDMAMSSSNKLKQMVYN
uniref:Uncharacterized protein n=1 Tax=Arundo donax TaxID=35708 RepID=A0A0A9CKL1_ARUDO